MGHVQDALTDLRGKNFRVLLYHSISDEYGYPFSVSPREFAWQMDWLHQQGVCVQSLEELLKPGSQTGSDCKRVAITFDDGYEDNFINALPVLDKYGYKATFFLVTDFIGKINGWAKNVSAPKFNIMDWEQIRILSQQGHILGSHTCRHIDLAAVAPLKAEEELIKSRNLLIRNLAAKFIPLAYPYGRYTQTSVDLLQEIGYSCGLAAGGFWGNCTCTSPWELRREDIHRGTSRRDFIAQVRGVRDLHYLKLGVNYLRKNLCIF